jgi:hypothetical protein
MRGIVRIQRALAARVGDTHEASRSVVFVRDPLATCVCSLGQAELRIGFEFDTPVIARG